MEKLLKLSLSFCCLFLLFSCGEQTDAEAKERRQHAEKRYRQAIQFTQGSLPFQNGIAEAVAIDPTYEAAIYELSVAHLKRGMPHKWLPQYNKALSMDPNMRYPWRGYLYLWFYRDYKKAIADFDASDSLTPNFTDAPQGHSVDYWRGIAYLGLKDYEKSIAYFDKHIQKETQENGEDWVEHEAFLYRGIAHFETGNFEKALKNFNTILKYNANFSNANYYKAQIIAEKNKAEALTIINKAIDDFYSGYYDQRPYVETMRQLYLEDFEILKAKLEAMN